jgi:hypothetical protein
LDALLNSHLVHEVPRFSKYLHGASQLYKDSVPIMPWWICELEKDIRKQPMANIGLTRSLSAKPLFNGHHRRSLALADTEQQSNDGPQKVIPYIAIKLSDPSQDQTTTSSMDEKQHSTCVKQGDLISRFWSGKGLSYSGGKKKTTASLEDGTNPLPPHKPMQRQQRIMSAAKKLDPKAFFANERTFISWLQFCALILTVALNLLNYGDRTSRMVGAIFIILASLISM